MDTSAPVRPSLRMGTRAPTGILYLPLGTLPRGKYKIPVGARVPMRRLGRTGADVSIVGLGGYHLGLPPEQEAIRMVQRALDHGMNFLDNCALCRARHNAHYADWRIMPTPMRSATERTERYAA